MDNRRRFCKNNGIMPPNWENTSPEAVRLILERGDKYLDSQLQLALAADNRAIVAAGLYIAMCAAILGFAAAEYEKNSFNNFVFALLSVSTALLIAASAAIYAARPVEFYLSGARPKEWWPVAKHRLHVTMGGDSENIQTYIEHNEIILKSNSRIFYFSTKLAVSSPAIGFVMWLIYPWLLVELFPVFQMMS